MSQTKDDESREPFYIYLQNSELNTNLQKYISSFVQHIAGILERDAPNVRRIISFLPERNGTYLCIMYLLIKRRFIVWISVIYRKSHLQIFKEIGCRKT